MVRPIRFILEVLFALTLIIAVPTGALVWRLQKGDIVLHEFLPDIQDMLSDAAPGLTFAIDNAVLQAGEPEDLFLIHARGIQVRNGNNDLIGSLQEMVLGFSWRNLLHLSIIPSRVDIQHPTLQFTRFEDGRIGLSLEANPDSKKKSMPELASILAHAPGVLKKIQVHDAWIGFVDKKQGATYEAQNGLFDFNREEDKVFGTLSINIKGDDIDQPVRGTLDFDPKRDATHFRTAINGLYLKQLQPFLPQIPEAINLDMPMDIVIDATISSSFQPQTFSLHLLGEKGKLSYAPYFPDPIDIADFSATLNYDVDKSKLMLRDLRLRLNKALLAAEAALTTDPSDDPAKPGDKHIVLTGLLENMPVNDLKIYWPYHLGADVREWVVDHLHEGTATRSGIELALNVKGDNTVEIKKLGGKIDFSGVTVNYLPPMPEAVEVAGEAEFDPDNFNIFASSGRLFDSVIKNGEVKLSGIREYTQHAAIDITVQGPIADAVKTIEAKPLEYPQRLGLAADQFSGTSETELRLKFPLLKDLMLDQVEMQTSAKLKNAGVKNVIKDLSLSNADLDFKADTEQLEVTGKGNLADAAAEISWHENFGDNAENTTILHAKGAATAGLLKGLRLPADQYIKGVAQAEADIKQDRRKTTHVAVTADLTNAQINIPELNVEKKTGAAGKLSLKMTSEKTGPTILSDVNVSWPEFQISNGNARWNNAMELQSATLNGFRSGRTSANIVITPQNNGVRAVIKGDVVDLSGYWAKKPDPNQKPDNQLIDISLRAKTFYLDPELPLRNMAADILVQGSDLVRGTINAQAGEQSDLSLKQTDSKGARQLAISIKNAGQIFKALDITDTVNGGTLVINGQSTPKDPAAIAGAMQMDNFTVVKAPVLARLINAFSPGGLIELLNGQGLVFSKMKSGFALEKPKTIRLTDGRMTGASIGLNFSGRVYRDKQTIELAGTIIPMEGLNKLVSGIPIIGQILTGIKGEGLIGATYKITGPTSNPDVSVNPLSVLTPGILRSILFENNH